MVFSRLEWTSVIREWAALPPCCVSVVPRGGMREQDTHPGARGRRLEPLGRLEHVQPHVRDGSPLPAEEMWQPSVSPPPAFSRVPGAGCANRSSRRLSRAASVSHWGSELEKSELEPEVPGARPCVPQMASQLSRALCDREAVSPVGSWPISLAWAVAEPFPETAGWQSLLACFVAALDEGHPREAGRPSGKQGWLSNWLRAELGAAWLLKSHRAFVGSALVYPNIFYLSC